MTEVRRPDPPPEPVDAWWEVPRFSANDVWKLLIEYGEKMPDHARKIVLDLWIRIRPR